MITFTVPGTPIPKARARSGKGHHYTPEKTREYEKMVAIYAAVYAFRKPLTGALRMEIAFYLPIPASYSRKRKAELMNLAHTGRPDLDNLVKAVLDGCQGIVYSNDGQVASLSCGKTWSDNPRVVVSVLVMP